MDDAELAAIQARHGQWTITADDRGFLTAKQGGCTIITDSAERLEWAIDEHETGRAAR